MKRQFPGHELYYDMTRNGPFSMDHEKRKRTPLIYLYQIYKFIVFFPLIGISTAIAGTMASLISVLVNERAAAICGVLWGKFNAYITPVFVKIEGLENIDEKQSYIIISNHESLFDILIVYGWLPMDFRWVMKIELRKVPFLGYACYKMGHVLVDRKDRASALASLNEAKKRLTNGTSILFFPEGTRNNDGMLREFKKGAFYTALDMGLPILPVTLIGTRKIVPNKTITLYPGRVKMMIHPPIATGGYRHDRIEELIAAGKKAIQKGLDDHS